MLSRRRIGLVALLVAALAVALAGLRWRRALLPPQLPPQLVILYTDGLRGMMLRSQMTQDNIVLDPTHGIQVPGLEDMEHVAAAEEQAASLATGRGATVMRLDGGNTLAGSDLLNRVFAGEPAARLLAMLHVDAMLPGQAEWLLGPARLAALRRETGLNLLCSNLQPADAVMDRVVRKWGERKVAVYGWYDPPVSPRLAGVQRAFRSLRFSPDRARLMRKIQEDPADLIVVLAAVDRVEPFARLLPRTAIVIPTRNAGEEDLTRERHVGLATVAPYVDARRRLGRMIVRLDPAGAFQMTSDPVAYPPRWLLLPTPAVHAEVGAFIRKLEAKLGHAYAAITDALLAYAPKPLAHHYEIMRPSPTAAWIGQLMCGRFHADLALLNHKAFREMIWRLPSVTGQVLYVAPFGDEIVVIRMSGATVMTLLRRNTRENARYLQIAGVRMHYRPRQPKSVQAWIDGRPLDPKRQYHVVTIDYLTQGARGKEPIFHAAPVVARTGVCLNHLLWDTYWDTGWVEPPLVWMRRDPVRGRGEPPRRDAPLPRDAAAAARVLAGRGAWTGAWAMYQKALARGRDGDPPRLHEDAAEFLLDADLPEAAEGLLPAPRDARGLLLRARIRIALMDWNGAMADLRGVLRLAPRNLGARVLLGWVAFGSGHAPSARQAWLQGARLTTMEEARTLTRIARLLPER